MTRLLAILALAALSCATSRARETPCPVCPGSTDETSLLRSGVMNPWPVQHCEPCGDSGRPGVTILCCDALATKGDL
jgi:hypothetical protein